MKNVCAKKDFPEIYTNEEYKNFVGLAIHYVAKDKEEAIKILKEAIRQVENIKNE